MSELKSLKLVNFDWVTRLDSVWSDSDYHVPELNRDIRDEIIEETEMLHKGSAVATPLGITVVGAAGAGKTHLLGSIRNKTATGNCGFVLVDMTDVKDFWDTVLLGYLSSIQQPYSEGKSQLQLLLEFLVKQLRPDENPQDILEMLGRAKREALIRNVNRVSHGLYQKFPQYIRDNQDVIRALFLLYSPDIGISNIGYSWLQALPLDDDVRRAFHFTVGQKNPIDIVKGLSWVFSLRSPVLLALDQLDAIVTQHHMVSEAEKDGDYADEQLASLAIIEGIGAGLSALVRSVAKKTVVVVSCLESTWEILRSKALKSDTDSFSNPLSLRAIDSGAVAGRIIEARLKAAFETTRFKPPYPSWPFAPSAFENTKGLFPRDLLRLCDTHRKKCIKGKKVSALLTFERNEETATPKKPIEIGPWPDLDARFREAQTEAPLNDFLDDKNEDILLAPLLRTACRCLISENPPPGHVDAIVDVDFGGGKKYSPLHSRIRMVDRSKADLEKHYCLRAIEKRNAVAFQARLKAAITAAGVDRKLRFRRLVIVRTIAPPGGAKTQALVEKFIKAGGLFVAPDPREFATLFALKQMASEGHPDFDDWLRSKRPVSNLAMMKKARLIKEGQPKKTTTPPASQGDLTIPDGHLPLGSPGAAGVVHPPVSIDPALLAKHVLALAGSGSGKTVLVRRLVEEAALLGIPSIVIDGANDLARLGDAWPEQPDAWTQTDIAKAARYRKEADVVIWTPGREKGHPLSLQALPDLAAVADDIDELNLAVSMSVESFREFVAPGNSVAARKKIGVLSAALENFALSMGEGLDAFLSFLSNLPKDASAGIGDAPKLAQQIADSIRAAIQTNPLMRQSGATLDPGILFGDSKKSKATRISVINFIGLPNLINQQQFLNQLAMTLFSWIKKHPTAKGRPIRGLLVIDEAKDFVPSVKSAPCKMSLLRLAAQARKYGLGLIFATQSPRDIDNTIITNCTTHFYGKASSPNAIKVITDQLKLRGGSATDIPRLETGQFYVYTENMQNPEKVRVPLCLSHHPPNPLNEIEVLDRARHRGS